MDTIAFIAKALANGPLTIRELNGHVAISESRLREILKRLETEGKVGRTEDRPAKFFVAVEAPAEPVDEEADAPAEDAPAEVPEFDDNWEPAGEPGTYLGDSAVRHKATGQVVNRFTGVELPAATKKAEAKTRRLLNPQPVINRKSEALQRDFGARLEYDRGERTWRIYSADDDVWYEMNARELSELSIQDLLDLAADCRDRAERGEFDDE